MDKFKCNGCGRKTKFIWQEGHDAPEGFRVYLCTECGCTGTKNLAEKIDKDAQVSRCNSCGAWQFDGKPCYTCMLIDLT
jgi:NMD protein affecting ribosome stability and mRNA decay